MPFLQAESQGAEGTGENCDNMSEMPYRIREKELGAYVWIY